MSLKDLAMRVLAVGATDARMDLRDVTSWEYNRLPFLKNWENIFSDETKNWRKI